MGKPSTFISTASTNTQLVKAGRCRLEGLILSNSSATVCHLKLYDKATTPAPATDTPVMTITVQANGVHPLGDLNVDFDNGFGFALVGGIALNDNTNGPAGVAINPSVVPRSF